MRGQVDREQYDRTTHAFFMSIMSMLGVPATLASGLVAAILANNRARARRRRDDPPPPDAPDEKHGPREP